MKANVIVEIDEREIRELARFEIAEDDFQQITKARFLYLMLYDESNELKFIKLYEDFHPLFRDCPPPFDEPK